MLDHRTYSHTLTLPERAVLLGTAKRPVDAGTPESRSRSEKRLERWKRVAFAEQSDLFARRLAESGLPVGSAQALLEAPPLAPADDLQERAAWFLSLADLLNDDDARRARERTEVDELRLDGFLALVEPQVRSARKRLHARLDAAALRQSFDLDRERWVALATEALLRDLLEQVSRTLVLELNVQRVSGALHGETAAERFHSFTARLSSNAYRAELFSEYPVLARIVGRTTDQWVNYWTELAGRLAHDAPAIRALLDPDGEPGAITRVAVGMGDRHRDGRTVAVIEFASGASVVYKPRSLAVDACYTGLLWWLCQELGDDSYRHLRHVDRGTHGWSSFAAHAPCDSRDDLVLYYRRLGRQLALLYVLDATDMHLENVIASGAQPHVIDLEALFHPRLATISSADGDQMSPDLLGWRAYFESVMRVGLLPSRTAFGGSGDVVELSGLGGEAGQLTPDEQPVFGNVGEDTMRVTKRRLRMPGGRNQPALAGVAVDARDFVHEIEQGFREAYRVIATGREMLAARGGPLDAVGGLSVRAVLRHTRVYAILLRDSFHPDLLRDSADRSIHFESLWRAAGDRPGAGSVVAAELQDLENGDVPLFTCTPASTSLWTSTGREIPEYFMESSMARVRRRLSGLSDGDLDRQCWFIRASLASLDQRPQQHDAAAVGGSSRPRAPMSGAPTTAVQTAEGIAEQTAEQTAERIAERIGARLRTIAYEEADSVSWLGLSLVDDRYWALQPVGEDLYNGRLGIALFFLELGKARGDQQALRLAEKILGATASNLSRVLTSPEQGEGENAPAASIGAFGPACGAALALAHGARVLGRPAWTSLAIGMLTHCKRYVERDDALDVIAGSAGYVLACLDLHEETRAPQLRECIRAACDHLLARAVRIDGGLGWWTPIAAHHPLTGISHGASGMALALMRAGAVLNARRFTDAARAALDYERATLRQLGFNWPDHRVISGPGAGAPTPSMLAWCHGAPGIGLARAALLPLVTEESLRREIMSDLVQALRTTCEAGFDGNHSLCHGALGNLALLDAAVAMPEFAHLRAARDAVAAGIVGSVREHGPVCGMPNGVETPGLMTGLAGIGLGMLRIAGQSTVDPLTVSFARSR
jgi:type 2 lantibiotic biosynthesis protein LanM